MEITKREFLQRLGIGSAALATGAVFGKPISSDGAYVTP